MNVAELVHTSATRHPARPAWRHGSRSATYASFEHRVGHLARLLCSEQPTGVGLRPGDRVVLCLPNSPELLELLVAAFWAGLVAVPVNWHLHPDEVCFVVADSGARAALVADETAPTASALAAADPTLAIVDVAGRLGRPYALLAADADRSDGSPPGPSDRRPEDPAWLFYTSGTTGRPKGATLSHRNLMAMTLAYFAGVDPVPGHAVFLHAAPLTHGSGLYLFPALARAATNVIATGTGFDPAGYLRTIESERVTHATFLAPTMLHRVVQAAATTPADVSSLRSIVVGGAPLYEEDLRAALDVFGPVITQIYGQGESPMTISSMPADELADAVAEDPRRWRSCGRRFVGVEVSVVDRDGRPVPTGESGEICVRGDVVMSGYWNNPDATASALRDGWLHTGDIGHLDEAGFLFLTDRSKDVIISGGSNIYPREVEEVLLTHPAVSEVAVIGVPDREWGEVVCAHVVTTGTPVSTDELVAHCREHLAGFKRPRIVVFTEALPKNAAGKVVKRELRARMEDTR